MIKGKNSDGSLVLADTSKLNEWVTSIDNKNKELMNTLKLLNSTVKDMEKCYKGEFSKQYIDDVVHIIDIENNVHEYMSNSIPRQLSNLIQIYKNL